MEHLEQIITIASAGVGLLATVTGFLIPLVKNVKAKNRSEEHTSELQSP